MVHDKITFLKNANHLSGLDKCLEPPNKVNAYYLNKTCNYKQTFHYI